MISRRDVVLVVLAAFGGVFGAALAFCPAALADPVEDAWPYSSGPGFSATTLPGFEDPDSVSNVGGLDLGVFSYGQSDADYLHSDGGTDWYSMHQSFFEIPLLMSNFRNVVTDLLDSSATFPHVGTTEDSFGLLSLPAGLLTFGPLIEIDSLHDPVLGSAASFQLLPGLANVYISDTAGVEDGIQAFGHFTPLFEIPSASSAGATAAELGDGFQQLLTELTASAPA